MPLVFAATLLVSAALLFIVEPMFAKMVLPLLGGSPSVWNTCLVFYQAALLAGYVYAHVSLQWLGARRQAALHLALLCLPWLVLPIVVARGWTPPAEGNPVFWLWLVLTVSIGLPFVLVSASAPMLQAWFSQTGHHSAKDPYFLYAASNLGSMLALVSYPLVIESQLTLAEQSWWWTVGYGLLMAMVAACAVCLWRTAGNCGAGVSPAMRADCGAGVSPAMRAGETPAPQPRANEKLTLRRRLRWLALAAAPSSLLLGVTAHISTDIASVPLLWVIPLALYLLSFVLVFARRQILSHRWMLWAQVVFLPALAAALYLEGVSSSQLAMVAFLHLAAFFVTAMVCHGELAADRPASSHLTEFYLWMSIGGVLGGLFNALVAPAVFPGVWEYPLVIVAACALRPWPKANETSTALKLDAALVVVLGLTFAVAFYAVRYKGYDPPWVKGYLVAVAAVAAFCLQRRPARFAAGVSIVAVVSFTCSGKPMPIHQTRSFFGVLRVENYESRFEDDPLYFCAHRLMHGSTSHGMQSLDPEDALDPWTYYHRTGPVGDVFEELERKESFRRQGRIGVVGLGTGTIAAYGLPGQKMTFFEIDPAVVRIARDPEYFTYLRDCRADVEIDLGDARLSLDRRPDGEFDVLLVDAFSSDAIPIHLLTREAMHLYKRKLAPHGLLAVHISNRHLDLEPVLGNLAADADLTALVCNDSEEKEKGKSSSTWVLLARQGSDFGELGEDFLRWQDLGPDPTHRLWTDDFSNVISVLNRKLDWKWLREWK